MEWELDVMWRERLPAGLAMTDPTARWAYVLEGEVVLETAGSRATLGAGDAALVDQRTAYRLTAAADSEVVHADLRHVVPSPPLPSPLVVTGFRSQHPGVAELVGGCPLDAGCRSTLFAVSYAGLVGAAMTSSWLAADEHNGDSADAEVADVLAALASRPGESWTLDRMADLVHLSRSALTDRFRRTVGRSPMQLLREVRMQQARKLLGEPSVPVTRIAFEVGYGSVAAFSRAFAAQHGESPQAWRVDSVAGNAEQCPDQAGRSRGDRADEQRRTYAEPVQQRPA
ncbi:AraC family transcriptional regulator [Solicola gregarius]|uniref:AraC family transcriptional regulator n=1 Tax=Solicola gregarius TaxID=2908642 RepID=A0AA46TEX0_9ACTN|nr:AraC family transcriptional regulator [Solicola gregarius]UYM03542.1 AraC family transcriptional regulator [Solicola gregarius]